MLLPGCAFLCFVICIPLYLRLKKKSTLPALCFKILGTISVGLPAVVAALRLDHTAWFCVVGIIFCALADGFLLFSVPAGGALFGAAHICFICWQLICNPVSLSHLLCILLLLAGTASVLIRFRKVIGRDMLPVLLYTVALCVMTGCCLAGGLASYSTAGWLIATGGILFLISDGLIATRAWCLLPRWTDTVIMVCYELSIFSFSISCLL